MAVGNSLLPGLGKKAVLLWLCFSFTSALLFPQEKQVNFNTMYRFPLSVGAEYQSLSPFAPYGAQFNIFELSASLRWPIPPIPVLQPTLRAGLMTFTDQNLQDARDWSHIHAYGAAGLTYANRFAKSFELGLEALAGFDEALFADLLPEVGMVNSANLLFEAGARIALNPSYNLSIDIHPNVKYLLSLSELKDFDGFLFGIGFSASYRFGQDPDAPQAIIRSLRFERVSFPAAFAAMQSYYVKKPLGSVELFNTEKNSITELQVSFFQAGYMDSPTPGAAIAELKAGERLTVELPASFNQQVFTTEGVTPLTGEIIASYKSRGRAAEQKQPVTYDLHDKTAVTWDDDRKVAAFITPADSALRNYASYIRQVCKEETLPAYSEPMQLAIQVFNALGEAGIMYQADPTLPFTKVQGNPMVVDSISLPRDTLKRTTGDCDDLTVLFCSLLETAGMETAFITVPGHIYAAFNTKLPGAEYGKLHPDRSMSINLDGQLWVPVEITLIGRTGFPEAWRKGVEEWKEYEGQPEKRGFYPTRSAQEIYRPVGLKETDLGLQYGRKEKILEGFRQDLDKLIEGVVGEVASSARKSGRKEDYNKLGILYGQFGRYPQAEAAFQSALRADPQYLNAQINLANLLFLKKAYAEAATRYERSLEGLEKQKQGKSPKSLKVLLNLSRAYYQMERFKEAQDSYARAAAIDEQEARQYAFLGERAGGESRAASTRDPATEILFVEGEE
jgi:hypothetical protein